MKLFILFLSMLWLQHSFAQYTQVINSKRPGFSESPFAVGSRVYQIEAGMFYQNSNEKNIFALKNSLGSDLFLRTGLLSEKLECNLNFKYQKDDFLSQLEPEKTTQLNGFSQFTVGIKYLIYKPTYKDPSKEIRSWKAKMKFDKKRLIPSVGIYAGLNTNLLSQDYKLTAMSPKVALLLQNDFDDYTIWVNNVSVDYFNIKEMRTYSYISTLSYAMTDRFSIFAEHQGAFLPLKKEFKLGGGTAYLLSKDLQLGLNMHWDMKTDHLNLYGGLGVSWRLDKHKEKIILKKVENKARGKGQPKNKEGSIKNIFKKKNKRR